MRLSLSFVSLAFVTLAACSSDPASQATSDGGPDPAIDAEAEAAPGPDGGGLCCPIDTYTCSPQHVGGWAPRLEDCAPDPQAYDGCPFVATTDAHGCATLTESSGFSCPCQCGSVNCQGGGGHDAGDAGDASALPDSAALDASDGG